MDNTSRFVQNKSIKSERGAALITVLLISMLVLTLAGALILTTSMSGTNAISASDEMQAYYAAEAGLQAGLNVLRGNVAPHPNDGTLMNFKNAVSAVTANNPTTGPTLSKWLVYDYPTWTPNRVSLSPPPYSDVNGIAYSIASINDPDTYRQVIYSTSGSFTVNGVDSTTATLNTSGPTISLNYTPQPSTDITSGVSLSLGSFTFSRVTNSRPNPDITISNTTFTLRITETAPLPPGVTTPISVSVRGTLSGTIRPLNSTSNVTLSFNNQSIEIPNVGTLFVMSSQTLALPVGGTSTALQTSVVSAEPGRLIMKVRGYGPHGAIKNMQAMVSRFGVNYDPPAAFVIRGNDDSSTSTVSIGSSANFVYSGQDYALGDPLPAFLVTNDPDYTTLSTLKSNNPTAVQGDPTLLIPAVKKVTLPTGLAALPTWLQTTSDPVSGARAFVQQLRLAAKQQFVGCVSARDATCDRYFDTRSGEAAPTDLGASTTNGLFTFVDGDLSLPNSGGRGLLVVTGTLTMSGSQAFEGLVLVLGGGAIDRSGAGNGVSLGAFVVAKFDATGGFLSPTFTSSGSGVSTLQLDRRKVKTALRLGGVYALAVSEF